MYIYYIFISAPTEFLFKSIIYKYNSNTTEASSPLAGALSLSRHLSLFLCFAGPALDRAHTQLRNPIPGSVLCYLSQEQKEAVYTPYSEK